MGARDKKKHLDIGCGEIPRNPFGADELHGLDLINRYQANLNVIFSVADVTIEKLPYPDNFFDSVSAYDFLEHVPRLVYVERKPVLAFVNLMSEIYRILKPNGKFYAISPFFPKESAFIDPTHVNFITKDTHKYFVEPYTWGKKYGFEGKFFAEKVRVVNFANFVDGNRGVFWKVLVFFYPKSKQHIFWEFRAEK